MNPEGEFRDEAKGLSGITSEFGSNASNIGGTSLGIEKSYKPKLKMKLEGEVRDETKGLSGTTPPEFYSSASNIGGISLKTGKRN